MLWGEEISFFSLVLIKWGVGVFKCCAPGLSHLGQLCKEGRPTRLGVPPPTPGTSLPSLWLLPLFYEELRCCNFLEPQFFGFLFGRFGGLGHFYPLGINKIRGKGIGEETSPLTFTFSVLEMGPCGINLPVFINAKISGVI